MRTAFYAFLLAAHVTACASHRPAPETAAPSVATAPDTARTRPGHAGRVTPLPALPARITDAIGLSTPEGRARRQARKDR